MSTKQEIKDFFNTAFFNENGQPEETVLDVAFGIDEEIIEINAIPIHPNDTIYTVFQRAVKLASTVKMPDASVPEQSMPQVPAAVDFRVVNYKHQDYIVQLNEDKTYYIQHRESRRAVLPDTAEGKGIIKKFNAEKQ